MNTAAVEFKRSLADTKRIIETVAALATIGGGVILIGVRDDGRVVGVDLGDGEIERFIQQILAGTDPRVYVDLDLLSHGAATVLRVRVPAGDGPHLAFGRAWYRSGPATVAMTRDEYERRLLDRLRESSGFERRMPPPREGRRRTTNLAASTCVHAATPASSCTPRSMSPHTTAPASSASVAISPDPRSRRIDWSSARMAASSSA